jgi:hypothetical protein
MKWTYQNQDRFEHRMRTPTVTSATAIVCVETDEDDNLFFYYLMVIMPILALAAYIYDALTLFKSNDETGGLLSSILFIFSLVQYSITIESKWLLTGYQFLLWIMVTAGDVLCLILF